MRNRHKRSLHTHSDYRTFCLLIFMFLLFESSLFHSHRAKWKNSTTTTSRGACHKASRQRIEAQTQQGHLSYVCLKFGNLPSQSETPLEMRKGPKDGNNLLSYSSSQKTSRLKKILGLLWTQIDPRARISSNTVAEANWTQVRNHLGDQWPSK